MAVVVKFLPRAERDLLSLPDPVQDEVMHKLELLAEFPRMGPMMEMAYRGCRFVLAGRNRYRIVYKIASSQLIEIVSVRHCRRQMGLRVVH